MRDENEAKMAGANQSKSSNQISEPCALKEWHCLFPTETCLEDRGVTQGFFFKDTNLFSIKSINETGNSMSLSDTGNCVQRNRFYFF